MNIGRICGAKSAPVAANPPENGLIVVLRVKRPEWRKWQKWPKMAEICKKDGSSNDNDIDDNDIHGRNAVAWSCHWYVERSIP